VLTAAEALVESVRRTLRDRALLSPSDKVLVALSGGPDSVALLHVLRALRYPVEIAHFDHQTRAGASAADAEFCRALARACSLPFHLESRAVAEEAQAGGASFEEHARRLRYDFLLRTAAARGCTAVATGHHADDQAETVLLRMVRGASPRGLGGIPPAREADGIRIVRPLIDCSRADILAFLEQQGLEYRTDATNTDPRHLRNRVRHDLLPRLREAYNPRIDDALRRLAEVQRTENEYLEAEAAAFLERCLLEQDRLDREAFARGHRALQRRAVLEWAWRHGVDCPFDRADDAVEFLLHGPAGRAFDLGGGRLLRNGRGVADLTPARAPRAAAEAQPLETPGETRAFGRRFRVRYLESVPKDGWRQYCRPDRQVFDAAAVVEGLAVRRRRPGDRFVPLGMTGTRKLQDYFTDRGVPARDRDEQLLLTSGERILWIVGGTIDARAAVTPATERIVEVEVMNDAVE
jgi:tRNA(Ile)-lysidine synthase